MDNLQILIAEPDVCLARTLAYVFECQGYRVRIAVDGPAAVSEVGGRVPPDLLVMETDLPGVRGFDVCRALRADKRGREVLVMFVSARAEEVDRVVAFEVGADDFVAKPFSVRELILRVRAVLRRKQQAGRAAEEPATSGLVRIDRGGHTLSVGGRDTGASPLEVRVMSALMSSPNRVIGRAELIERAWGAENRVKERTVDCTIKRLRRHLGMAGSALETVRGVGLRWRTPGRPG